MRSVLGMTVMFEDILAKQAQIEDEDFVISLCADTFGKVMNPAILP